jgi:hypothetical protein
MLEHVRQHSAQAVDGVIGATLIVGLLTLGATRECSGAPGPQREVTLVVRDNVQHCTRLR